jgi:DNA/RNA endonuclease YhcR with UshA esterase domain
MLRPASFKLVSVVALIVLLTFIVMNAETTPALKYDKSAEVKVKGVIDDVKTAEDATVHVTLKNDKGSLDVVVAPEKFLKEMEIIFAKGETIEVLGSQLTVDGNPVLLAREVTRNGDVMVMRDERGKGVWVGWIK